MTELRCVLQTDGSVFAGWRAMDRGQAQALAARPPDARTAPGPMAVARLAAPMRAPTAAGALSVIGCHSLTRPKSHHLKKA